MKQLTWFGRTVVVAMLVAIWLVASAVLPVGRVVDNHRVISVGFYMFLEVLRALESLAAEFAPVRLQGNMDPDVRGDVVAFDHCNVAVTPCALQVEVICAFASDVSVADVLLLMSALGHTTPRSG